VPLLIKRQILYILPDFTYLLALLDKRLLLILNNLMETDRKFRFKRTETVVELSLFDIFLFLKSTLSLGYFIVLYS